MKVGEICERDVVVCARDATVVTAAKLMRHHHVGCVVVADRTNGGLGTPLGILTDRDIVLGVTALDLEADVITAGDIMLRDLCTVRADQDVLDAMHIMRSKGVRRLPVVNGEGLLLGIVSFDDVLGHVTEQLSELTRAVGREQAHEAVARR